MSINRLLIGGGWRPAQACGEFVASNPKTGESIDDAYPVSSWEDCDEALTVAAQAFEDLRDLPTTKIAEFLNEYADRIDARSEEIAKRASEETALPYQPRLKDVELPRTTGQLRQAANAAIEGSWALPTIDTSSGIRSCYAGLGPVVVFGPNNFPMAFGSISGGDFAAAIAAGNPVIAKANSMHPGTTKLFAEEAIGAVRSSGLPEGTVQLIYRTPHDIGERLVSDPRVGASGYTGSREAGLRLKSAADKAGKPIYLELSSVNPVAILPGAIRERGDELTDEFCMSCLMGTGQFCTNPGLVMVIDSEETQAWIQAVRDRFSNAPVGTLLSDSGVDGLDRSIQTLRSAGAEILTGGERGGGEGASYQNTLMSIDASAFLSDAETFQTEAFGNASLLVVAKDAKEISAAIQALEGNLTGTIYSHSGNDDDEIYELVAKPMRQKVGRLLNDKMPTGVAVSPAMNHGGPYPATGHPGFTAVGIPGAMIRFAMLQCYDQVRHDRLPALLRDDNPMNAWRLIDGRWTRDKV